MQWSNSWQMFFNTSKCKVMHLGRSNKEFHDSMGGQKLQTVNEKRDLGVQFTNDLKVETIQTMPDIIYFKASKVL